MADARIADREPRHGGPSTRHPAMTGL